MGNTVRGIITHQHDGKTYNLRLGTNEWCELEDEFKKPTSELLEGFATGVSENRLDMRFLRSLFRAALSGEMSEVTDREAGALMTDIGLVVSAELIGHTIKAGMPEVPAGAGKPKRAARQR